MNETRVASRSRVVGNHQSRAVSAPCTIRCCAQSCLKKHVLPTSALSKSCTTRSVCNHPPDLATHMECHLLRRGPGILEGRRSADVHAGTNCFAGLGDHRPREDAGGGGGARGGGGSACSAAGRGRSHPRICGCRGERAPAAAPPPGAPPAVKAAQRLLAASARQQVAHTLEVRAELRARKHARLLRAAVLHC